MIHAVNRWLRLFLPGQDVPEWLELFYPTPGHEHEAKKGALRFGSLVIVWNWRGQYFVRRLVNLGCIMVVSDSNHMTILGQYPGAVKKPVIIHCDPIIPDWLLGGVAAGVTLWLLS